MSRVMNVDQEGRKGTDKAKEDDSTGIAGPGRDVRRHKSGHIANDNSPFMKQTRVPCAACFLSHRPKICVCVCVLSDFQNQSETQSISTAHKHIWPLQPSHMDSNSLSPFEPKVPVGVL